MDIKDTKNYRYKWRYKENERPLQEYCCCYDCGISYSQFQDMVIPDELWELINPTYCRGSGLLCPTCIVNRLHYIGKWYQLKICYKE